MSLLFFADRLPPLIGGMEIHGRYFIEHFTNHADFPLCGVISKDANRNDCLLFKHNKQFITLVDLPTRFSPSIIFFNSGCWIEKLHNIKKMFPKSLLIYRTGGNEILKAPLEQQTIFSHSLRQLYWVTQLNQCIDYLITNSAYTESRLKQINITCPFIRCVGGVNTQALKFSPHKKVKGVLTIFCAARFVPYKNHVLLLKVFSELIKRGYNLRLRLAGDGPLLPQIKKQVLKQGLSLVVIFLEALDNIKTCQEIAKADIYMQLSTDRFTEVPGGSYIHSEGMGRSILEALSAGTYVIASHNGALSEIVTEERGMLVEIRDASQIANQVENIIKNLPRRQPFTEEYSWEKVFSTYERIFRGTL